MWILSSLKANLQRHITYRCPVRKCGTLIFRPNIDLIPSLQKTIWRLRQLKCTGKSSETNMKSQHLDDLNHRIHQKIERLVLQKLLFEPEMLAIDKFIDKMNPRMQHTLSAGRSIEYFVGGCRNVWQYPECQEDRPGPPPSPLQPWQWPSQPWSWLHITRLCRTVLGAHGFDCDRCALKMDWSVSSESCYLNMLLFSNWESCFTVWDSRDCGVELGDNALWVLGSRSFWVIMDQTFEVCSLSPSQ